MSLIRRMLRQYAVYWPLASLDGNGMPVWGNPVQIRVRWEDSETAQKTTDVEIMTPTIKVYVSALDGTVTENGGDVEVGGMLLKGVLLSSMTPQARLFGAKEIMGFDKSPNFHATEFIRTAWVRR